MSATGLLPLLGDTRKSEWVAKLQELGWGRMVSEKHPAPYPDEPWGFDNGAFSAWLKQEPFPHDRFLYRLDIALDKPTPYLAVVPDLVARGIESLEFSLGWLDSLPDTWPWYLAVQDGMKIQDVEPVLDRFAGIFLGGTTRFKSTAPEWYEVARRNGKRFHYARASTPRRIEHAKRIGADSLDSAFPLWTEERFNEFITVMLYGSPQAPLL